MIYGYARVSTTGQVLHLQTDALKLSNVDRIFSDTITGSSASRPGLDELLPILQVGDTVIVWRLDRLGRSVRNLLNIAETLKDKGVRLKSITDGVDTSGPMGSFLLAILGAVAELERGVIRERVKAGMQASKARGRRIGRKKKLHPLARQDVVDSVARGESVANIAER